jgi:hypothetical protein
MTTEIRVRTRIHPDTLESVKGKVLKESDLDVLLTGPTAVKGPDGKLIAHYLPRYFDAAHLDEFYPTLHALRVMETDNRGMAGGTGRAPKLTTTDGSKARTRSTPVASAIIGAFDANPHRNYCRLTAWTGTETEQFSGLWPLFREIGDAFAKEVPDRFQAQQAFVRRTPEDWVVPGTPFTTITINNSYPTGVHTDKGDLDEGFSNLTVLRRGKYHGGIFTFPEFRVGVDMQDGDLLLMDAHQWHGNTEMFCDSCGERIGPPNDRHAHEMCGIEDFAANPDATPPERISIVCYYRTKMAECGTAEEEAQRAVAAVERRITAGMTAVEEMAEEAVG